MNVESTTGQTVQLNLAITHLARPGVILQQDASTSIPLYEQTVSFKRSNYARYNGLTLDNKSIRGFTIGFIVSASVSLLIIIALAVLVWRWSKNIIHLDDAVDDRVIRTKPGSQIT